MDSWYDFLSKQLPAVTILGFLCVGIYKYLTGVIDKREKEFQLAITKREADYSLMVEKKDTIIEKKDNQIIEQNKQVMTLYGQAIESQNKSIMVKEQMLTMMDRLEKDIQSLNNKL